MERITLTVGGTAREYLLFVPPLPGLTPEARLPLVIVLHGTGGTAAWADGETGWSALAAREGFALALPEATRPHPDQPPKFLLNPQRWNDTEERRKGEGGRGSEDPELIAPRDKAETPPSAFPLPPSDDVEFLAAVIDDAVSRQPIDARRVYLTGFSNGAGMTFRAAGELADRFAAIAPVAGYCPVPEPKPVRPVPTLFVIGTADPLVPLRGGHVRSPWVHRLVRRRPVAETLERWAAAIGCGVVPEVESDADGVRTEVYPGPVEFRAVYVDGLGHHWPGGKGQFNHRIAGPPADRFDATPAIWRFFRRHTRH